MENMYGVGTHNRYAFFLDDESDPLDALKAREQAKELKKKTKDAEKENKGKAETKPKSNGAAVRKGIKETQNVKGQENKNIEQKSKPPARQNDLNGDRPPPSRREDRSQNGAVENKDGTSRPPRREFGHRRPNYERRNYSDNPEGGQRRGPRPPRDPRDGPRGVRSGYDNRGKREFNRKSDSDKTGVKPIDKRDGARAQNWGNLKNELNELNKPTSKGEANEKPADVAAAGDGQKRESESAAPVNEEPRELTLDEYKALRNAQRSQPQYNLRKAGEGEDLSQWKNLVFVQKKKEDAEEDDSDEEYDISDYPQRVEKKESRQKRVLGIEFTFSDNTLRGGTGSRDRGRGGGRGRGRGGGRGSGRGGGRGRGRGRGRGSGLLRDELPSEARELNQVAPPKVDDSKDFPSLS